MSKSLLLISNKTDDQQFAEEVALTAGLSYKCTPSAQEGSRFIAEEKINVVFVDVSNENLYNDFKNNIQNTIGLFSDHLSSNAIHFISSEDLGKAKYLVESPLFGHYILRNFTDAKKSGQHYGLVVRATLNERAFGIQHLSSSTAKTQIIKLTSTSLKQSAVEAVRNFLISAQFQNRMANIIANAVDELLMNSMFDAPVDELGKPTYNSISRSTVLPLYNKNEIEMHFSYDGEYVVISAIDHFGSLDKIKLLAHISKIYAKEEYKVKTTVASAGLGLATVFRSGGSFFFVSEAQSRTEVTVFFKKEDNFRLFKDQFRFISTQFYF